MRWPIRPLAEVAPVRSRKPEIFDGTRRYYSTGAVGKNGELDTPELVTFAERPSRANCMPKVGDVGFARMNGTQKVVLVSEAELGSLFSTGFCILEPNGALDSKYLFYFLTSEGFQTEKNALAGEGIMGGIKNSDVANMQIPLPPMSEQQRIVHLLDEALEGIAIAKANAEKNLQNSRALFESYLETSFTKEGWENWQLRDIAASVSTGPFGSMLHKSDYSRIGVPLINPINIVDGRIVPDERKLIKKELVERLGNYVLMEGDIVVGRRGEIGRCAVVGSEFSGSLCGTGCFFIRLQPGFDSQFIAQLIQLPRYRRALESQSTGTTMKNLSNKSLADLLISVPPLSEQQAVVRKSKALEHEVGELARITAGKIEGVERLKQSILHGAFSNQIVAA